jgi:hypothetical protein
MNLERIVTETKKLLDTVEMTPETKSMLSEIKNVIDNILKNNKEKLNDKLTEWTAANETLKTAQDASQYRDKQIRVYQSIKLLHNVIMLAAFFAPEFQEKKTKKKQETENKED